MKPNNAYNRARMLVACPSCGKERVVEARKGIPRAKLCNSCSKRGPRNPDGKSDNGSGYWIIFLHPNDFFYPMTTTKGRILEHRLVMAKHLGRCLHRWEIIHHRNGDKRDNRIENLQLVTDDRHRQITLLENRIKLLEGRITLLEAERVVKQVL